MLQDILKGVVLKRNRKFQGAVFFLREKFFFLTSKREKLRVLRKIFTIHFCIHLSTVKRGV